MFLYCTCYPKPEALLLFLKTGINIVIKTVNLNKQRNFPTVDKKSDKCLCDILCVHVHPAYCAVSGSGHCQ